MPEVAVDPLTVDIVEPDIQPRHRADVRDPGTILSGADNAHGFDFGDHIGTPV